MKIDPYCQRLNCNPLNALFRRCIGYVDIAGRSPAMGRQTSAGWGKHAICEQNASISLAKMVQRAAALLQTSR